MMLEIIWQLLSLKTICNHRVLLHPTMWSTQATVHLNRAVLSSLKLCLQTFLEPYGSWESKEE